MSIFKFRREVLLFLIGIAGGSGSGKTTFTKKIKKLVDSDDVGFISMDSYYLDEQPENNYTESGKPNYDHPRAFDWELLFKHLRRLKAGDSVDSPTYNFAMNSRNKDQFVTIGPCKIVLFEGIFTLFQKEIRDILDIKCFLSVDADIRFTRRLHRDTQDRGRSMQSVIAQYYETVRPMYQKFLDPQKQFADFTIGEETDTAAEILAARIKEVLHEASFTSTLKELSDNELFQ